jgi:hypothetical protein
MGFLDKLLGRKKSDASEGMATAPPPATMPEEDTAPPPPAPDDTHEHSHDEGDHTH